MEKRTTGNETTRCKQAFAELFGPELTARGFVRHRNEFWRMRENGHVQSLSCHPSPFMKFMSCRIEWLPSYHGTAALCGAPYTRRFGGFRDGIIESLQEFVARHDPSAPVQGNLGDMVMDFDEWLQSQYELLMTHALPILERPCDCQIYIDQEKWGCGKALALMYMRRWDEASAELEARIAWYAELAAKARAAGWPENADDAQMAQVCRILLQQLRRGDHAGAEEILRCMDERACQDMTAFSKRLGAQYRFRD